MFNFDDKLILSCGKNCENCAVFIERVLFFSYGEFSAFLGDERQGAV